VNDWKTPTFGVLSQPVLHYGLRPKHLLYVTMPPGCVFLGMLVIQTITHSMLTWAAAILFPLAVAAVIRAVFIHLCNQDPHWLEHVTSHRWPQTRWLAR